jgi:hypothetical protein
MGSMLIRCFPMICDQLRIGYASRSFPAAVPIIRRAPFGGLTKRECIPRNLPVDQMRYRDGFHHEIQYIWGTPDRVNPIPRR